MGFVVLLKSMEDDRSLPIFIGAAEAQAIALKLNKVRIPRPLTHDLFKNVLDYLECRLLRVEVCDLKEGTFYARLILGRDGQEMSMDARPSDAIALALRFDAPVAVDRRVMDEAGRVFTEEDTQPKQASPESKEPPPEKQQLTPLQQLEAELAKAVKQERYEDAAKLRDKINDLKNTYTDN